MIVISGSPFDIAKIIGDYPADGIERQLLEQLSASTARYQYDSVEQLQFELRLRKEIVDTAWALYGSDLGFAVFYQSKCDPAYWVRLGNGGFQLRNGVKSSDAIKDIFINGRKYATECATAMLIVYYGALLNIFHEDTFNRLFPSIYLMNFHGIDPLLREVGTPKKAADILLGDRGYFKNPDVDPKTPQWQGENVIVLPEELYYGHGLGVADAEKIIRALNMNRWPGADRSAYLMDAVARPDFTKLANIYLNAPAHPVTLYWRPFPPAIQS